MPVIQELAGHASITMTRRNTHPADERKQQSVEALLGSPKGLEPAAETLKSPNGQIVEVANGNRSISYMVGPCGLEPQTSTVSR
jgi:hypothetical protein